MARAQFGTKHAPDGARDSKIRMLCVTNVVPEVTLPGPVRATQSP